MKEKKVTKVFSLKNVDYCNIPELDVIFFIHNENSFYPYEHTHDFYELTIVEEGKICEVVEGEKFILEKNNALLLKPGIYHTPTLICDHFSLFSIGINVKFLTQLCNHLNLILNDAVFKKPITTLHLSQTEINNIISLLTLIGREQIKNNSFIENNLYYPIIKTIISQIILKAINNELTETKHSNPHVSLILRELSDTNNFKLNLIDICSKLNLSHGYTTHLFKKEKLDPPSKIFLRNKLNHANMLLQNSSMKIIDIMETCGIYSTSYFNKSFKSEFGISPTALRKTSVIYNQGRNLHKD